MCCIDRLNPQSISVIPNVIVQLGIVAVMLEEIAYVIRKLPMAFLLLGLLRLRRGALSARLDTLGVLGTVRMAQAT